MKTVGSYEAQTHMPRLLDEVARGRRSRFTRRRMPAAVLVPLPEPGAGAKARQSKNFQSYAKALPSERA